MYFDELDLNDNVLDALDAMRFDTCTPIQEKCIPEILDGHDVLGVAQTGTGKTAAYLLPILSKLADGGYPQGACNCVIMSPTRELAQQIDQAMQGFAYYLDGVSSVAIYGGNDGNRYDQELKSLNLGADVIIATPGRLISHLNMGNADFSKVSFFVLDEADRMLDMGFSEDIMKIAKEIPDNCQTIMFSATMPDKIEDLAKTLLKNPVEVKIAVSKPAEKIHQSAYVCYENQKLGIIKDLFKKGDMQRVIIFSGKKQKVKAINRALMQMHINSGEMHSDLEQAERDAILYKFKSGQIDVLVATDIVARGIDIDDIAMVINFDVPHDPEDYVHRIGRTARADRDGVAITFVSDEEVRDFKLIEKFLEKEVEKLPLPDGLGEAPDYASLGNGRGNRTSAKSRRRKDRDATAHKHKPRRDGEDRQRKPKQERKPKTTEDAATQPVAAAEAVTPVADGDKAAPRAAEGGEPTGENRRSKSRRGRRCGGKPRGEQGDGTQNTQPADAAKPAGDSQPRQERQRQGKGDRQSRASRQAQETRQPASSEKSGKSRSRGRGRKSRQQRAGAEQTAQVSTKYSKTSEMSPLANASKDSGGLKSLLKNPLKWIKSFGK